jgi:peptide/nickel transport system substrate-binding protein
VKLGRGSQAAAVALLAALGGCDFGSGEKSVVIASPGDADHIVPLLATTGTGLAFAELMFEKLADIGPGQNTVGDAGYEPRLARSWQWSADSLQVSFVLDPHARWHDGRPVRAADVRFGFQVLSDPKVAANGGGELRRNTDSVSVVDSLTAKVWYKRREPEQFHAIAYNLFALPEHLLSSVPRDSIRQSAYALAPVGNGPFTFVAWQKQNRIEFAANKRFARGRPNLDRVIFTILADGGAAARAVIAGDADFLESISIDDAAEAAKHPELRVIPVRGYEYSFLEFNLHTPDGKRPHPILASRAVRRALTMATNRADFVKNVHDSLGRAGIGPFSRSQWSADTTLTPLPYDVAAAEKTLDSLGWTRGADGTRARGGQALEFGILVNASNRIRVRYAELVQQAFANVGVKASIEAVDLAAFRERLTAHRFDATVFTWRSTPSPSGGRTTWTSAGFSPGSPFNAGGYLNKTFDAHYDSALAARTMEGARAHFRMAYLEAIQDPPAIWLYEPMNVALANTRLETGPMRVDAWWQSIQHWDVTGPAKRSGSGRKATTP